MGGDPYTGCVGQTEKVAVAVSKTNNVINSGISAELERRMNFRAFMDGRRDTSCSEDLEVVHIVQLPKLSKLLRSSREPSDLLPEKNLP